MDPKQTEGQGSATPASQGGFSFSSEQSGAAQPGTLSTGANVSRTMDDLNVNDRKSATSSSPFAKHQFNKIAPGTGDIIIGQPNGTISSAPGDKEPKINRGRLIQFGLIFGGIALVGLVIFTVVMVINNQSKTNNSSNTNNNSSSIVVKNPETAFEEFLEVLVNGSVGKTTYTTSDGKTYSMQEVLQSVTGDVATSNILYADQIINYDTTDTRTVYLEDLSSALETFSNNYSGENEDILEQITYYYEDFAKVLPVKETDIIERYLNNGLEQTQQYINDSYSFNDDRGINDYNTYSNAYATAILELVNEANTEHNCNITATSTDISGICPGFTAFSKYQAFSDAASSYYTTAQQIKLAAWDTAFEGIQTIYLEYNDTAEEGE